MFMIATIQRIAERRRRSTAAASWTPRNGNVKWSIQTPNPTGIAAAMNWPPSFCHQARPRKSSTAPTIVATAAPSRMPAHLGPRGEERERRDEDPEEEREPAEPRDGQQVEPPRRPAGRRRRACAPSRPTAGVSSTTISERERGAAVEHLRVVDQRLPTRPCPTSSRTGGRLRRRGRARCSPSRSARGRSPATTMRTSGWSRWMCASPSGAAISAIRRIDDRARLLHACSTAAAVELPVASIGSSRITSRFAMSCGSFT